MAFVDYGALARMRALTSEKRQRADLKMQVVPLGGERVFVKLVCWEGEEVYNTIPSQWTAAHQLFEALLSPQGSIHSATIEQPTGVVITTIIGSTTTAEMERMNKEQLAKFLEECLLPQPPTK